MIPFVLIGALLALLTLALLTRPLWRRTRGAATLPGASADVAGLRQQLEQLKSLNESGALGDAPYAQARQALEQRLVNAVVNVAPTVAPAHPIGSRRLMLGLSAFVGTVALAGYAALGTPRALDPQAVAAAAAADGAGHTVTREQIEAMVDALATRLKERPDDADGWMMLGRSYAVLGRPEQALPALKRAVELRGDDAQLLADYADTLAVANGRSLAGEPARLIARAVELDPDNLKARSLAGSVAFDRKDYAGAIRHWEHMVRLAPGSELTQQIQGGIDEARRLLGGAAPAPATPTAAAGTAAPPAAAPLGAASVSGTVTLSSALVAQARPEDTVFVFARAAEGPRMPLAILRKQVKDLPLTFTLDDSMAMSPAARLSSASRVVVGARISKGGDATPQPGDLQGFSAAVAPGATKLKVEIAEVVGR